MNPTTTAPEQGSTARPPLTQDEPRRPGDFGLDVRRLRTIRLIAFGVLAIPLLLLGLLALKFVSLPVTQAWHGAAYEKQEYTSAIDRLAPVWVVNWFEPYLPHLTKGTDLLQAGDDAAAEAELRTALEVWEGSSDLNQPIHAQCKILNNLAISIERQADLIEDPAERADRLFEAEQMLFVCASGGGGGQDGQGGGGGGAGNEDQETTDENEKRVEEKRRGADEEAGNDPDARQKEGQGGAPDPGSPRHEDPSGTGPTEEATTEGESSGNPKEDELEERNKSANQGDGESSSPGEAQDPEKPW